MDGDYRTWVVYCRAHLMRRGVWSAVVQPRPFVPLPGAPGTAADAIGQAEAEKAAAAYDRKKVFALADIQLAVKPHLLYLVGGCETAAEAWSALQALFQGDTTSRRAELEMKVFTLSMRAGESVLKYVGGAKDLRTSLATAGVVDERSMVLHVLRGLPTDYEVIKTVLQNIPVELCLDAVAAKLMTREKKIELGAPKSSSMTGQAMAAAKAAAKKKRKAKESNR